MIILLEEGGSNPELQFCMFQGAVEEMAFNQIAISHFQEEWRATVPCSQYSLGSPKPNKAGVVWQRAAEFV